jgi:hypothetical protein
VLSRAVEATVVIAIIDEAGVEPLQIAKLMFPSRVGSAAKKQSAGTNIVVAAD